MAFDGFRDAAAEWKELQEHISEVKLSYLLLLQRMIRSDRAMAMYRLGLSPELAELLVGLPVFQLIRLASSELMRLDFRLAGSEATLKQLTQEGLYAVLNPIHASLVMSAEVVEDPGQAILPGLNSA